MARVPTKCPSCSTSLQVTGLTCPGCAAHLEGRFDLHALLTLNDDDLQFILSFVRASGSLKEMARQLDQSYPTVRNRLDGIIAALGVAEGGVDRNRRRILDAIAEGTLSVKDGIKKLKEFGS